VAGIGGELALPSHRLADRHQGAPGIQPSERDRGGHDAEPAEEEDGAQAGEGTLFRTEILEHLDDERAGRCLDRPAQDPDRLPDHRRGSHVGGAGSRRRDPLLVREAELLEQVRQPRDRAIRLDHQCQAARGGSQEADADGGPLGRDGDRPAGL
jgi:hypothetical protein